MKLFTIFVSILLCSFSLSLAQQQAPLGKLLSKKFESMSPTDASLVLITFKDKGSQRLASTSPRTLLSEKAIQRRAKVRPVARIIDEQDLPLEQSYVKEVEGQVTLVRHQLNWFNALSAMATKEQIDVIRLLPFVKEIELVGRWRTDKSLEKESEELLPPSPASLLGTDSLSYGPSATQLNQINVPAVHNMGVNGQGIIIGSFDNGVRLPGHEAFANMKILATYDFVDHKKSVVPVNTSSEYGSHGVNTLSTIGGYKPGSLIGPAFGATYIVARTENDSSETPVEEDNWAKAIQWADSIGVDVTTTSLGYLTYDSPYTDWTYLDMNGNTTLITRAADRAVGLGIVVLNSAGNGGVNASHNTLGAPADGDSVISVGAVDPSGLRSTFSSIGPTTDVPPRIKPDVMAMGSSVVVANSTNTTGYTTSPGTSFSCPLSAGVAALVLSANPTLTPMQVREALRNTASNSASPNNYMGWGILNARNAIGYYGFSPTIRGTIYYDTDGDGTKDTNEVGLASTIVHMTGTKTDSVFTDSQGNYVFYNLSVGNFSITIDDLPEGKKILFPSNGSISVTIDSTHMLAVSKNFSIVDYASVTGSVFHDINGNGIKEGGEPTLPNWTVNLSGNTPSSAQTDTNGVFTFSTVNAGTFALSLTSQTGWVQSTPAGNFSISFSWGQDRSGYMFGVMELGSISGILFADSNSNGTQEPNELGMSNWKVMLGGTASTVLYTDTNGAYTFTNLLPGGYTVTEELQSDWVQTYPPANAFYVITLVPGTDTSNINFGNHFAPHTSYVVTKGWNLLSMPQLVDSNSVASIYPSAISPLYIFSTAGHYSTSDTVPNNSGYWLKFASSQNILIAGTVKTTDTIQVVKGWNLIGSLTDPVLTSAITSQPENIITTEFYKFNSGYSSVTTLQPHTGYWVKVNNDGVLILQSAPIQKQKAKGIVK